MRLLALVTDAYGAGGGIAAVNRVLLSVLAAHPAIDRIDVRTRVPASGAEAIPGNVHARSPGGGGAGYVAAVGLDVVRGGYDGVLCGHLHLSPLAAVAAARARVPWVLVVHGIEAWGEPYWPPSQSGLALKATARAVRTADRVVSVSGLTKEIGRAHV